MQFLGWWVIGLRPGLAYPCLSLNSLCLGQYKVECWDGEPSAWRSVSASQTSDFRPSSHPNTRSTSVPVSVATRAAGRGGRKKRQNKRKGCRAAPFDKLHAHPTILMSPHARQGTALTHWESSGVQQDLGALAGPLGRASDHQEFHWGQSPMKRDQQYNRPLIYTLNGLVGLLTQKTNGCFAYWQKHNIFKMLWKSICKSITFSKKGRQNTYLKEAMTAVTSLSG